MNHELTREEVRVLGCLIEKEMATPDYYPLSLNALVQACNQKSNRNPVVSYSQDVVEAALTGLIAQKLVYRSESARVHRFGHLLDKAHNLVAKEMAVIALLMLRGSQTAGELRNRTERLYAFASMEEVEQVLHNLQEIGLVKKNERKPGQKEARFSHLLAVLWEEETRGEQEGDEGVIAINETAERQGGRVAALEQELGDLREEVERLRAEFLLFRQQFD